jgi:predicted methyltransferase
MHRNRPCGALLALTVLVLFVGCNPCAHAEATGPAAFDSRGVASTDSAPLADVPLPPPQVESNPAVLPTAPSGAGASVIDAAAVVAQVDRSEADRALDAGRKPTELLAFAGIALGMRVAELGAGGGYTSELLARAVGPTGKVFGHNSAFLLQRFAEAPWSERLAKPIMANVVRVDGDFDDPLPPDAVDLDVVVLNLFYHDTIWQGVDRAGMNRAILAALAPGGVFIIADHSAAAGAGTGVAATLHRIEERVVIDEVTQAGFVLERSADFLRNPADTRDWNASPRAAGERRGQSDRFVLAFRKPGAPAAARARATR